MIQRRDLLFAASLCGLLSLFVGAALFIMSATVDDLLTRDAESTGHGWARYLAQNIKDLDAIVAGAPPSAESLAFFEQAQRVGNVFRYKIFDAQGHQRLVSDELTPIGQPAQTIAQHNPTAAEVLLTGRPSIAAKEGTPPRRPTFYAEAYVPVQVAGRTTAIVEVYVDQAERRATFRAQVVEGGLLLAALMALAFGLPAAGFYWRTREKRAVDARIDFLADHDGLTHLANRARFTRELDAGLGRGASGVLCVDLDRLKDVNDAFGHAAGDELLRILADRLRAVAGPGTSVARLGGDEFALAPIGFAEEAAVEALAVDLSRAIAKPFRLEAAEVSLTASIGVAVSPRHGRTGAELVKSADIARHHAKGEGRGRIRFFSPDMDAELQARRDLERVVRAALAEDRFDLHFQPLYSAGDRRLQGFEALLRLPSGGGFVSPAEFIPIAEDVGLITTIGAWVLHYAAHVAAHWPDHLTVAVNLSPAQFQDGRLCAVVADALARSGLSPHRLELEITEGLLLQDTDGVLRQLADLKALGVSIAMDDFGTGYSSLSYFWKFPFDKIKIDGSFMRAFATGDRNVEEILAAIVSLGHSLRMRVTGEGIETEAQASFLEGIRCDQLQGFHLGRPMPAISVPAEILRDGRRALPTASVAGAQASA